MSENEYDVSRDRVHSDAELEMEQERSVINSDGAVAMKDAVSPNSTSSEAVLETTAATTEATTGATIVEMAATVTEAVDEATKSAPIAATEGVTGTGGKNAAETDITLIGEVVKGHISIDHLRPFGGTEFLGKYDCSDQEVDMLVKRGFRTLQSIVRCAPSVISALPNFNPDKAARLIEKAKMKIDVSSSVAMSAAEYLRQNTTTFIRTGIDSLDQILGGGIRTKSVTQIFGRSPCGRTHFCHTIAAACQYGSDKDQGMSGDAGSRKTGQTQYAMGRCFYLFSKASNFMPQRIEKIAQRFSRAGAATLDNISVACADTVAKLNHHLDELVTIMEDDKNPSQVVLLVIDSLMEPFNFEFPTTEMLWHRQAALGPVMRKIQRLANVLKIAVVFTNQDTADKLDETVDVYADGDAGQRQAGYGRTMYRSSPSSGASMYSTPSRKRQHGGVGPSSAGSFASDGGSIHRSPAMKGQGGKVVDGVSDVVLQFWKPPNPDLTDSFCVKVLKSAGVGVKQCSFKVTENGVVDDLSGLTKEEDEEDNDYGMLHVRKKLFKNY